jgi:chemotaxis regulatin CheY-phosphate phosphatase CheZ
VKGKIMKITPDEWREFFKLRDELEDAGDRALVRRLIKYVEYLEQKLRAVRQQLTEKE